MNGYKWYWETYVVSAATDWLHIGIRQYTPSSATDGIGYNVAPGATTSWAYVGNDGDWYQNNSGTTYGDTYTAGDVIGVAVDLENNKLYFSKNGVWQDSGDPTSGATGTGAIAIGDFDYFAAIGTTTSSSLGFCANFGSDSSFAGATTAQGNQDGNEVGDFYYTPPTDYLALCTSNLPDPEIALSGDHFNTKLYTGDGATTLAVSGVGFQPDFTWIKNRDQADDHILVDSVRGATNYLVANETDAEVDDSTFVASLDSDGFTVGDDVVVNTNTENYVSWNWEAGGASTVTNTDGDIESEVSANTTAGFSIVSYTGDADNESSVGHGLTTTPGMIILKALTGTQNWIVWHKDLTATTAYSLYLNTDGAETNNVSYWYDAAPNATTFHPGDGGASNGSGTAYIAYCFESIEGYSKMGSYDGNGNADGPFIYTGFRPAYIMIRVAPSWTGGHWHIFDTKRYTYNETTNTTTTGITADNAANDGGGGGEGAGPIDILSNGFKIRNNNGNDNANGDNILYIAFAESPFKYSNAR
jgi:hypothetical protein